MHPRATAASGERGVAFGEPEPRPAPDALAAWRGFLRVHSLLIRRLDSELEERHGLPVTSYEVLAGLADAPGGRMRMAELAESVLLSRSGLTRLVDRLEREGLVERCACPQDARGAFAVITPSGRARFHDARQTHLAGVRERFLRHFSESELAQLRRFWSRFEPEADA